MVKICLKCKEEKEVSEFDKNRTKPDGLNPYCKTCRKEYYQTHKEEIKQRERDKYYANLDASREYQRKWHNINYPRTKLYKEQLLHSLKTSCRKCGETRLQVIQFHHVIPRDKNSKPVSACGSTAKIIAETKKCICLCANCHMEFHQLYGTDSKNKREQLIEYLGEDVQIGIT